MGSGQAAARRLVGYVALVPVVLWASGCSGGGGSDTRDITEGADYSDGTLTGDVLGDGLSEPGDWQDRMPDGDEVDLPDDSELDEWGSEGGAEGAWFSTDDPYNSLALLSGGTASLADNEDYCDGTYTQDGDAITLRFPGCYPAAHETGEAVLTDGTLTVGWADGTTEVYSQDIADQPSPDLDGGSGGSGGGSGGGGSGGGGGGGGSQNVGEEISGVWSGNDGSLFMVIPAEESGTGIANASYLAAGSDTECIGILLEDLLGEGWDATLSCEVDSTELIFGDVTLDDEVLTVTWPDTGESADYQWIAEWDEVNSGGAGGGTGNA
ncbi:hypothetical protein ACTWP5_02705 [Streptomyces sp. 4N509B]|uniref:hypothetical protein n=1 Tax=Streptomyces sp. 4N509B TaxID=3457413 RepID=UPI003FD4E794